MNIFNIDYTVLARLLLPVRLRQPVMQAWLRALISPVVWLYNAFKANRTSNLYFLAHNSQVCFLQAALNDVFDPVSRGIIIVDGPFKDPLPVYLIPESKPVWLGLVSEAGSTPYPDPQVLYTGAETSIAGIGFIVKVPVAVAAGSGYDVLRLKALVNRYRIAGRKVYSVVTY